MSDFPGCPASLFCSLVPLPAEAERIWLRAEVDHDKLHFSYSTEGEEAYQTFGPVLDASTLSDEASAEASDEASDEGWFTGAFVACAARI